jgi:four helix bundle protein
MKNDKHVFAFEKLKVWEEIRSLIKSIYLLTKKYPDDEKFGLAVQMRRAIISVSSNLAEGTSRISSKDQAHFYQLSYSSLMEVLSQLIASNDLEYVNEVEFKETRAKVESVSYLLNQLRSSTFTKHSKQNSQFSKLYSKLAQP